MAQWTGARWFMAVAATGAAAVAGMVVVTGRRARLAEAAAGPSPQPLSSAQAGQSDTQRPPQEPAEAEGVRERVTEAVRASQPAAYHGVEVSAPARDMVELRGTVERREDADQAVQAAQGVAGVRTVVNRLVVAEEERRAEEARSRRESGDPAMTERGVHGLRVGMGQRRQGAETDPDRPDDSGPRKSHELRVERVAEQELVDGSSGGEPGA